MIPKVLLGAFILGVLGLSAFALGLSSTGDSQRLLSDADLTQVRGMQTTARWCWPVYACTGTDVSVCAEANTTCVFQQNPNLRCKERGIHKYFNPEECNTSIGNETCSSQTPSVNVKCDAYYDCYCNLDNQEWKCSREALATLNCRTIQAETYCYYVPCPE